MKVCNNCGYQNEDNDLFCKQCGKALEDLQKSPSPAQNPYPLLQLLKKHGSSGLFLVSVVAFTLKLIVDFVTGVLNSTLRDVAPQYYNGFQNVDPDVLQGLVKASSVGTLIGLVPMLICCIGLWKIYGNCKKEGSDPLSTSGFSLVKGVMIFNFVIYCIGLAVFAVLTLGAGLLFGSGALSDMSKDISSLTGTTVFDVNQAGTILLIYCAVILVVGMILGILYFVKLIGSLNRAKEIVVTGSAKKNVSLYVAVINIIGGGFALISSLVSFNLAGLVQAAVSLLFAIVLLSFRSAAKDYIN